MSDDELTAALESATRGHGARLAAWIRENGVPDEARERVAAAIEAAVRPKAGRPSSRNADGFTELEIRKAKALDFVRASPADREEAIATAAEKFRLARAAVEQLAAKGGPENVRRLRRATRQKVFDG